ncbi:hypothetical protein TRFO_36375 [Tritrichomonas foetus]|uniref:Uncharacterized protein n=1 Tax=Tritrichomonas foetus TaxID=1144522 RepID=A0A1J4JGH1_9EUKA|nr:hypothetical protein TRFO_36375 [Tritrichomonas foetus]|eukprot:OHS97399.1 hypothetical protein TRFO_36375 [Tritrichomonas foetus]
MSDISLTESFQESLSSSTDSTQKNIKITKELNHINDLTNAVMKENSQLRAQYEQESAATDEINSINKKNVILTSQIRKLLNEKEDLNHRLQISIFAREEIEKKVEQEKSKALQMVQIEREKNLNELKNIENRYKIQIDHLYSEIEKMKDFAGETNLSKKILESNIEKILSAASHYFSQEIKSVDGLVSCLEQSKTGNNGNYNDNYPQYNYNNFNNDAYLDDCSKKKDKKNKNKIRKLKEEINQLKVDLQRTENTNNKLMNCERLINQECERKIQSLKEDYEMKEFDQKREIDGLNIKIGSLENELKKRKKQLKKLATELEAKRSNPQVPTCQFMNNIQQKPSKSTNEIELLNQELNTRNDEYRLENEKLNRQICVLQNNIEELEKQKNQIMNDQQKSISDFNSLQIIHKETTKEIESLRAALLSKKDDDRVKKQKKYINKMKIEGLSLQKTIDALQEENEKLKVEREKFNKANEELSFKGEELINALTFSRKENTQLKDEISELKTEMQRNVKTVNDFVNPTAFICNDLPPELREKIADLVSNNILSINTKISHSFQEIYCYYSKVIKQLHEELKIHITDKQKFNHDLSHFIVNIAIALEQQPTNYNFDNFESLVEDVRKVKAQLTDSLRANREQTQSMKDIKSAFGPYSTNGDVNVINEIESLNTKLSIVAQSLEKEKKRAQKYKNILHKERQKNEVEIKKISKELDNFKMNISSLENENKKLKEQHECTRHDLLQEKSSSLVLKQQLEESKNKYSEEIETLRNHFTNVKTKYEEQIKNQIEVNNQQTEAQVNYTKDNESVISALNNTIATQKKIINSKNEEIQRISKEHSKKLKKTQEAFTTEKENLINTYTNTMKELQSQCDKHRNDFTILSEELTKSKKKSEKLSRQNKKLQMSLCEMKIDLEKLKDSNQRDNALHDFSSKATIAAIENRFNEQLNDLRRKQEMEKMKIFRIAAEEMRDYFNANESMDENQFRRIIKQANDELHKLRENETTIRRMLSSSPSESTTEAVAQILLRKC